MHCNRPLWALFFWGLASLFASAHSATPATPTVLVVGDSLSAEYGLKRGTGWVALLAQRMQQEGKNLRVVNASVSGDTTAGGRSRMGALLQTHTPQVVVIELGGNDALRGLPLQTTRDNLLAMAEQAQQRGAKVLLLGMQVPPNYGADYNAQFQQAYQEAAKRTRSALVPFFLSGVADGPQAASLFQSDRIHPNESAQGLMLDNVWPSLKKILP